MAAMRAATPACPPTAATPSAANLEPPVPGRNDLHARRVFVDWKQYAGTCQGSFGVVFPGRYQDDNGIDCDVAVKVSVRLRVLGSPPDDDALNETLRSDITA